MPLNVFSSAWKWNSCCQPWVFSHSPFTWPFYREYLSGAYYVPRRKLWGEEREQNQKSKQTSHFLHHGMYSLLVNQRLSEWFLKCELCIHSETRWGNWGGMRLGISESWSVGVTLIGGETESSEDFCVKTRSPKAVPQILLILRKCSPVVLCLVTSGTKISEPIIPHVLCSLT